MGFYSNSSFARTWTADAVYMMKEMFSGYLKGVSSVSAEDLESDVKT